MSLARVSIFATIAALTGLLATPVSAQIVFDNVADDVGIDYARTATPGHYDKWLDVVQDPNFAFPGSIINTPLKRHGNPGVALLDFDGDDDIDIYVTNGPGTPNSLYSNQLKETGSLSFVDVAAAAGVEATAQDGSGVCYGDVDNDGDPDLYVLGLRDDNILFENNGNGTFDDVTAASGLGGGGGASVACSMGDIDNDGLLDIAVANAWHMLDIVPILVDPFGPTEGNQLFLNDGNNEFTDISVSSGYAVGPTKISWAITLVDYDQDGDIDLIDTNDQGGIPSELADDPFLCAVCPPDSGMDVGLIHVFQNDGTGAMTDVTIDAGFENRVGAWMGLNFADYNCDGIMDMSGSNFGDYISQITGGFFAFQVGPFSSRWFYGTEEGYFDDPGLGPLVASPFGWGINGFDYDNDGDTDILMNGGMDLQTLTAAVPAWMLRNDGCGNFQYDDTAVAQDGYNRRRSVQGQAVADLDQDGFTDVVTVSNFLIPDYVPIVPYPVQYGAPHEPMYFVPTHDLIEFPFFSWNGFEYDDGDLTVDMNNAATSNNWVKVDTVGAVGLTEGGTVNRDGVGATVSFTPRHGTATIVPRTAGSSFASQDEPTLSFGLGDATRGQLDVLWPGGTRNKLYGITAGSRVTMPEIPCSYDGDWSRFRHYRSCVTNALHDLVDADVISWFESFHLYVSAVIAYIDHRY